MKIAKLRVDDSTIDDVVKNIMLSQQHEDHNGNSYGANDNEKEKKNIKEKILKKLTEKKGKLKDSKMPTDFVLIDYANFDFMASTELGFYDCFKVYKEMSDINKFLTKDHIWACYEFENTISPAIQLRYESFFAGFLFFYDTESRNGMIDHNIYFRWQSAKASHGKLKKDVVTVYLDPAPLRHPLKPGEGPVPNAKTVDECEKLAEKKNERLRNTFFNPNWTPPDVNGLQSDPPSPSGPPPPYPG